MKTDNCPSADVMSCQSSLQLLSTLSSLILATLVDRVCWKLNEERSVGFFRQSSLFESEPHWAELTHERPPRTTYYYLISSERHEKWQGEISLQCWSCRQSWFLFLWGPTLHGQTTGSWTLHTKPSLLNAITHTSVIQLTTLCLHGPQSAP